MKAHVRSRICAEKLASPATFVSCGPSSLVAIFVAVFGLGVGCGDDHPVTADAGGDAAGDAQTMDAGPADLPASGDAKADAVVDVGPESKADVAVPDAGAGADAAVDAGDGGTADGKPDGAGEAGSTSDEVWPADAIKMVAEDRGGGFGPAPPAGSACQWSGTYTLTVATKNLAWRLCQPPAPGAPYQLVISQRTLTDFERDALVAALDKVAVSTAPSCGADKGVLALKVTTAAGEKEYLDNFYACLKQGVYVTNIDGVFQVLRQLVK
jgi:hypothetical protein